MSYQYISGPSSALQVRRYRNEKTLKIPVLPSETYLSKQSEGQHFPPSMFVREVTYLKALQLVDNKFVTVLLEKATLRSRFYIIIRSVPRI